MYPVNVFMYNEFKRRWTAAGNCYLRKILKANPNPTRNEKKEISALIGVSYSVVHVSKKKKKSSISGEIKGHQTLSPKDNSTPTSNHRKPRTHYPTKLPPNAY